MALHKPSNEGTPTLLVQRATLVTKIMLFWIKVPRPSLHTPSTGDESYTVVGGGALWGALLAVSWGCRASDPPPPLPCISIFNSAAFIFFIRIRSGMCSHDSPSNCLVKRRFVGEEQHHPSTRASIVQVRHFFFLRF